MTGTIRIAERVSSRNLRSPAITLLVQPFTRTDFSRRPFRLSAPSVWNSLPRQFRSTTVHLLLNPDFSNRFLPNTDRHAVSAIEVRLLFFDLGRYIPEEGKLMKKIKVWAQGRIQGEGEGSMPPVVSVCNIFLRVVVGVQTYHAAYIQALCQQNC